MESEQEILAARSQNVEFLSNENLLSESREVNAESRENLNLGSENGDVFEETDEGIGQKFRVFARKIEKTMTKILTDFKTKTLEKFSVVEKQSKKVSETINLIRERIDYEAEACDTKFSQVAKDMDEYEEIIRGLTNKVNILQDEVKAIKSGIARSSPAPANNYQKIFLREFDESDDNPMQYINDIKKLIKNRPELEEWGNLYCILDKSLIKVNVWWSTVKEVTESFEEFVAHFKSKFFNRNIQRNYLLRIKTGMHGSNRGRLSHFFLKNLAICRNLDNKMTEEEIVETLVEHLPYRVKESITLQQLKSATAIEKLLQNYDERTGPERRQEAPRNPESREQVNPENGVINPPNNQNRNNEGRGNNNHRFQRNGNRNEQNGWQPNGGNWPSRQNNNYRTNEYPTRYIPTNGEEVPGVGVGEEPPGLRIGPRIQIINRVEEEIEFEEPKNGPATVAQIHNQ